jgi:hypothetical protein
VTANKMSYDFSAGASGSIPTAPTNLIFVPLEWLELSVRGNDRRGGLRMNPNNEDMMRAVQDLLARVREPAQPR